MDVAKWMHAHADSYRDRELWRLVLDTTDSDAILELMGDTFPVQHFLQMFNRNVGQIFSAKSVEGEHMFYKVWKRLSVLMIFIIG